MKETFGWTKPLVGHNEKKSLVGYYEKISGWT